MIDPATQAAFNAKEGLLPSRIDVDPNTVDACTQYGLKAMADPSQQLASVKFLGSGDFSGARRSDRAAVDQQVDERGRVHRQVLDGGEDQP